MKPEKGALAFAFRKATEQDLPAISGLYDKAFAQFTDTRHTYNYFAKALEDDVNHEMIVATDKDGGFAGFLLLGAQNSFLPRGLNVDVVAVDEKQRGKGLGRALMKKAEDIALRYKFTSLTLQVHEDNAGAIGLYESMDYVKTAKAGGYYRDGKDAWGMYKPLEEQPWTYRHIQKQKPQWV